MKPIYTKLIGALSLTATIAACVPAPRSVPPVQTRPTPAPAPAPTPMPAPSVANWLDAPQTPGDWSYSAGSAQFGPAASEARFAMRCDAAARTVILTRFGVASPASQIIVRSESQARTLPAISQNGASVARLAASDRLLDAMALSKGRFAVEVPGTATLYLPSWAEVTRVIEDCR